MAVRPIDANELYRIEKLLDTDIVRQDKVALNLLEQVLYDIQHVPTLTPPNEWVSVEDAAPDPGERVLATDGIFVGEAYRSSANSWFRHTGFPWRDGVTGRTVRFWMPLPAPPGKGNNVPTKAQNEPLTIKQLREMDGEPVYDYLGQEWYVIQEYYGHELTMTDGTRFFDDDEIDGVDKRFYRRPPEGEDTK